MRKAVLISIRPEWCAKIASGEKTIEVRKTRPKLPTPFKCYIYRTIGDALRVWEDGKFICKSETNGKVIGEFVCDYIMRQCQMQNADLAEQKSLVKRERIFEYANGKEVYGWHISDLKIYDEPKKLSEFLKYGYDDALTDWEDLHCIGVKGIDCVEYPPMPKEEDYRITRAPQSWCYVEELP